MNILIVSHGIPSKKDPQWGCFELDQARALRALGHQVSMVAVDGRFSGVRRLGYEHNDFDGIDTCLFFLLPLRLLKPARLRVWARERMMLSLFRRMARRHGLPDVIYAHYFFSMSQLRSVRCRYPDIPIVGVEHAGRIIYKDVFSRNEHLHFERAYKTVDKVLSVSPALQDALYRKFQVSSEVLSDMVGQEFLDGELVRVKSAPFKFVTTASLVADKAIDLVIKALPRLDDQSTELYIVGDGPERGTLANLAASLGVSGRVHLLGMCNKQQIIDLYQKCDAFVLPSRLETFCVVNIEAMAMGLPVISTRCGGPEYYIEGTNGILLDVDDFEGLVVAMNEIERNIDTYKPEDLREYVRAHYSGEVIARQAEGILQTAVKQKKNQK